MIEMIKKTLLLTLVLAMLATSFVFADSGQSVMSKVTGLTDDQITTLSQNYRGFGRILTASVVAKLTDMSIEDVLEANQAGATFFEIAQGKGIELDQFNDAMLDEKLDYIDEQVKAGTLTEDQAKVIKERMSEQIANCNGLGNGQGNGFGMGMRNGQRNGFGLGMRNGQGNGFGRFNQSNSIFNQ
jgi:opacity protein-like surface antigen